MRTIRKRLREMLTKRRAHPDKGGHIGKVELRDGVTIVRLQGAITFNTLDSIFHEHESRFKGKKIKRILADFKNVREMDTAVIAALVDRLKAMRSDHAGGAIGLINLPPKLRALLEVSKTKDLFKEYRSEKKAIDSLRQ